MLLFPIYSVSATKPETITLTGTFYVMPDPQGTDGKFMVAGESGNILAKWRGVQVMWTGDIAGNGYYYGNWLIKPESTAADISVGTHFLEDATTIGVGTGNLAIGHNHDGLDYFVKSGSGDFSSIRGRGFITPIDAITYDYEIVIQINP